MKGETAVAQGCRYLQSIIQQIRLIVRDIKMRLGQTVNILTAIKNIMLFGIKQFPRE